jgi:hypothetical protein
MENTKRSSASYWLLFLISLAAFVFMLIYVQAWFWLPLPFVLTFFVKALNWM